MQFAWKTVTASVALASALFFQPSQACADSCVCRPCVPRTTHVPLRSETLSPKGDVLRVVKADFRKGQSGCFQVVPRNPSEVRDAMTEGKIVAFIPSKPFEGAQKLPLLVGFKAVDNGDGSFGIFPLHGEKCLSAKDFRALVEGKGFVLVPETRGGRGINGDPFYLISFPSSPAP